MRVSTLDQPVYTEDPGPRATEAAYLSQTLPLVAREVNSMKAQTKGRVFQAIRDGTLTPELAMNAWMEVFAQESLLKRLETSVKLGATPDKQPERSF